MLYGKEGGVRWECQLKNRQHLLKNPFCAALYLGRNCCVPPLYDFTRILTRSRILCFLVSSISAVFLCNIYSTFSFLPQFSFSFRRAADPTGNGMHMSQLYNARGKKLADPTAARGVSTATAAAEGSKGGGGFVKRKSLVSSTKAAAARAVAKKDSIVITRKNRAVSPAPKRAHPQQQQTLPPPQQQHQSRVQKPNTARTVEQSSNSSHHHHHHHLPPRAPPRPDRSPPQTSKNLLRRIFPL